MVSKEELKQWFETGNKPTQEQFWEWIDSYLHKSEALPVSQLDILNNLKINFWWHYDNRVQSEQFDGYYFLLGIEMPGFGAIFNNKQNDENYVLLIDRYRHKTKTKGRKRPKGRHAGFRHETQPTYNNRINEILLTSQKMLLDFNQDLYFNNISATGTSNKRSISASAKASWVDLSFRIRKVKNEEVVFETNSLGKIRMVLHGKTTATPYKRISYFEST